MRLLTLQPLMGARRSLRMGFQWRLQLCLQDCYVCAEPLLRKARAAA